MSATRLTDHFNRVTPETVQDERMRLNAIRSQVARVMAREAGGLAGRADRPNLTCVVQDVWLKLERGGPWASRSHFLGAAANAARQVLIDEARRRSRRPAGEVRDVAEMPDPVLDTRAAGLIETLGELLDRLRAEEPRAARALAWRVFGGLSPAVIAETEGVSKRTIERDIVYARAWIAARLDEQGGGG